MSNSTHEPEDLYALPADALREQPRTLAGTIRRPRLSERHVHMACLPRYLRGRRVQRLWPAPGASMVGHQGYNIKIQALNYIQIRLISDVVGSGRMDNPRLRCALISVKTIAVILPRMRSQVRVAALAWSPSARLLSRLRPASRFTPEATVSRDWTIATLPLPDGRSDHRAVDRAGVLRQEGQL